MLKKILCLAFVVSSAFSRDITVENSCPEGAVAELGPEPFRIYRDTYCFVFTTKARQQYHEAESSCKAHNGSLAMPKTDALNVFLEDAVDELGIDQPLWIGIDDRESEGNFVYADGTPVDWDNFNQFRNPLMAHSQDCVALDNRFGLWNVYRCEPTLFNSDVYRPFICQYKIQ